jgi:radical SAM protein with 4Fe4S-binding SPASM domain
MSRPDIHSMAIQEFGLWEKLAEQRVPLGFDLELTARCNLNCRHCYVNLSPADKSALTSELSTGEILDLAREAVSLGAVWCTLTGGEPLLRNDFSDIYIGLKKLGLLITVHTNATLIRDEHLALFKKYPPRDLEVTVYGVKPKTYERVTRREGAFARFERGLHRLREQGVGVRLKAMAIRSNVAEIQEIFRFCRDRTKDYFRFDPFLHMRSDYNPSRNREIAAERLTPAEIIQLENSDAQRSRVLVESCGQLIEPQRAEYDIDRCRECVKREGCERFDQASRLITCGAGMGSFFIAYDGTFRLCASLCAPDMTFDLNRGSLTEAWEKFAPEARERRTTRESLLRSCNSCPIPNLCLNCPAHAELETGDLEATVSYYCELAHARRENLERAKDDGRERKAPLDE